MLEQIVLHPAAQAVGVRCQRVPGLAWRLHLLAQGQELRVDLLIGHGSCQQAPMNGPAFQILSGTADLPGPGA